MRHKDANRYSAVTKLLHWAIAIAVITMLIVGFMLDDIPKQYQGTAYMLHKSTGITILFLMIARFIWVQVSGRPASPPSMALWEKVISRFVQYCFYVLLLIMPITGWIMSVAGGRIPRFFNLFNAPLPGTGLDKSLSDLMFEWHETIAWILIVFILLHIAGAIKHHFIDKDDVLKRMLPEGND